jgi:hypothetical protein
MSELTHVIHFQVTAITGKVYEIRSTEEQFEPIITALMSQDHLHYPVDVTGVERI